MPSLADVISVLQRLAPPELAEEWDNTGLLIGDRRANVTRVVTCLTLTSDVAAEAVGEKAELIVTHHPVLFRPVKRLTADDPQGAMLLNLIAHGIAVYSPHTSYDSATEGINRQLAELLGLADIQPLRPRDQASQLKLVTFVPREQRERVQRAVWEAGAGRLGEYSECSYFLSGTGTFRGSEHSNPTIGEAGRFEEVAEDRVEFVLPSRVLPQVVAALRSAHPYEEPAFDVYPLQPLPGTLGAGRCGTLPAPLPLADLIERVKQALGVSCLQFVGAAETLVRRVAIACGSAAEFLTDAKSHDCQTLLTGEARFHDCLKARDLEVAMLLPGHYATERPAMETLARRLSAELPELHVTPSREERDPLQWST